jgi:hypothetical protein
MKIIKLGDNLGDRFSSGIESAVPDYLEVCLPVRLGSVAFDDQCFTVLKTVSYYMVVAG